MTTYSFVLLKQMDGADLLKSIFVACTSIQHSIITNNMENHLEPGTHRGVLRLDTNGAGKVPQLNNQSAVTVVRPSVPMTVNVTVSTSRQLIETL